MQANEQSAEFEEFEDAWDEENVEGEQEGENQQPGPPQSGPRAAVDWTRATASDLARAPRPEDCRLYTIACLAADLPDVMKTLLEHAKRGSVGHLKLLVQITGVDQQPGLREPAKPREKNLEEILMEQWAREQEARAAQGEKSPAMLDPNPWRDEEE
jgi:hypothetical protein